MVTLLDHGRVHLYTGVAEAYIFIASGMAVVVSYTAVAECWFCWSSGMAVVISDHSRGHSCLALGISSLFLCICHDLPMLLGASFLT